MKSVAWVRGLTCESIAYDADTYEWVFGFGNGVSFRVAAPWRIIAAGRIGLGHEDHGQQFGLPRPVDGVSLATDLLRGRAVRDFGIATVSSDVTLDFGDGYLLEVFNSSAGYEGWTLSGSGGRQVVAQGGGNLVEFPTVAR